MTEIINSGIQPVQNLSVMKRVIGIRKSYAEVGDKEKVQYMFEWGRDTITTGFKALEQLLAQQNEGKGFKYSTNDTNVTMTDICLVPQVYNAERFGVDMGQFPNIARINANCMELEAFKATHPSKMIDAIPPSKL